MLIGLGRPRNDHVAGFMCSPQQSLGLEHAKGQTETAEAQQQKKNSVEAVCPGRLARPSCPVLFGHSTR